MFLSLLQFFATKFLVLALHLESGSFPRPLSAQEEAEAFAALRAGDPAAREKAARRPGGSETIVFPRPAARDILRRGTRNDSQPQPLSLGSASEHRLLPGRKRRTDTDDRHGVCGCIP